MKFTKEPNKQPEEHEYFSCIRERVLEDVNQQTKISRNHYGAEVLNTETTMFIDCDLSNRDTKETLLSKVHDSINRFKRDYDKVDVTFRVYETFNGYRIMVLGKEFEDREYDTLCSMFDYFPTDWLYEFLCEKQDCFRARLTPKPGRIGIEDPKITLLTLDEDIDTWVVDYDKASVGYKVCNFVEEVGTGNYLDHEKVIVKLHDERTRCFENLKLA